MMNRHWMPVSNCSTWIVVMNTLTNVIPQFGLGSRTCIGRHISMLEMCKVIPRLVRDFRFTLHPSLQENEWHTRNYWFVKPLDFRVQVQRRQT